MSQAVEVKIRTFLDAQFPSEKFMEIDGQFEDLKKALTDNTHPFVQDPPGTPKPISISMTEPWTGLQYVADVEQAVSVPATNTTGTYRETGFIAIHVVNKAQIGVERGIKTRCEAFQNAFRGKDIDGVRIVGIVPYNFSNGTTLDFVGGGYVSATITLSYEYDRRL